MIIDGNAIAADIVAALRMRPVPPGNFTVISCGMTPASASFIARKRAMAGALGIPFLLRELPAGASQADIERAVAACSADPAVRGVVLQLPLPHGVDRDVIVAYIDPKKDVDNLTARAPVASPAVLVVREILSRAGRAIADFKHVAVIGRGFLVGAPVIRWLEAESIPHHVVDIDTPDPDAAIRHADLVISGAGKTGAVNPAILADGAGFIDFGFPPDADQSALAAQADRLGFSTPTPGGTGPILVAKLFENFYSLG